MVGLTQVGRLYARVEEQEEEVHTNESERSNVGAAEWKGKKGKNNNYLRTRRDGARKAKAYRAATVSIETNNFFASPIYDSTFFIFDKKTRC